MTPAIESLPTILCPKCAKKGWLVDCPPDPQFVIHSYFPDNETAQDWCDLSDVPASQTRTAWTYEKSKTGKTEWLTPPEIIKALGTFDLDPCSPIKRPWNTAAKHFTIKDDGLKQDWFGRVWCNPPYDKTTAKWLAKFVQHGNGIALIFARTETKQFHKYIWQQASALFFIQGRLTFYNVDGTKGQFTSGAPSVLVAMGQENVEALRNFRLMPGKLIELRGQQ